ncbi:site-specific integrase [Niveibacterium sp. 24ML]|uniref:site-specific integrase n=1 Tax=Niveibacterium sp. 24ML TaxID=2985512 RepID=UPI00227219E6|nr:site-specific integrase [Niveibacterium sp. 24ML]MCX9157190.1 site-specific integrase [Niveibacterium sp. 24ML]
MAYLVQHHGTFWFSIRVPVSLQGRFGPVVRVNLQTTDHAFAKPMALRLASEWLSRFDAARAEALSGVPAPALAAPALTPPHQSVMHPPPVTTGELASATLDVPATVAGGKRAKPSAWGDAELLRAWRQLDPDRASTTVRDMESVVREFRRTCRTPFEQLTRVEISAYRNHLLKRGAARGTVAKRVGMLPTLLQVGVDAGMLAANVARGLRIPKAEVPTLMRRGFTSAELTRVFSMPVFRGARRPAAGGGEACIWIPMLALATGARLEELAQLRVEDIEIDPTFGPILHIRDTHGEQRLKTEGSRRRIPLHGDLVAAGLLEYWDAVREAGHEWLFPALEPDHDGRRGANFGKWFMRAIRSKSGAQIEEPKVVFHSFRHGFKTLCRAAELKEEIHDALTGHVSGTVGRTYGEMPLGPLVDAIARIELPVALPRIGQEEVRHG